jgi:hypothetical protein
MVEMQGADILKEAILLVTMLLFVAIDFIITFATIKKDVYGRSPSSKNKIKNGSAGIFASFGAITAFVLVPILFSGTDQNTALNIVCIGFLLVAGLSSYGLVNFMKCYYIKKYTLENRVILTLKELKMMKN